MAVKLVKRKSNIFRENKKTPVVLKWLFVTVFLTAATAYAYSEDVLAKMF
ncbi:MAG: hypothetical protein JXR47_08665 [Thiotrichales bacterium]|jgi:hypothetical protein|nr:hypothetical protein [Thiotrichales bacterium]MBN2607395.1 hypothetical protein [Thiotrichales bacterium]